MFTQVIKRDGRIATFERQKIEFVIQKTLHETDKLELLSPEAKEMFDRDETQLVRVLTDQVIALVRQKYGYKVDVESVQDIVEDVLKSCGQRVSERFHEVRLERSEARQRNTSLFKTIQNITKTTDRENANVGYGPSPKLLQIAEAATKVQAEMQLPSRLKKAWEEMILYYHDFSWAPVGTTTCVPDFEYTLLKDQKGNTMRVQFDFFNTLFEKYVDYIYVQDGVESIDLEDLNVRYHIMGRTGWTPLNKLMRRKMNDSEKMYKFTINKDFPLHLTEKHQVPVIRNGEEILVEAQDIAVGDRLLKAKRDYRELEELDIIDLFVNSKVDREVVRINNAKKLIQYLRYYYDDFVFSKEISIRSNKEGISQLTLDEYQLIETKYAIPYEVKKLLSVSCVNSKKVLPAYMPITEELGRLLGYIASEGSINYGKEYSNFQISIHNQHEGILEDIKHCIYTVFNENPSLRKYNFNKKPYAYALCGKLYVMFIQDVLKLKESVDKIHIPSFLFQANDVVKYSFLAGLYDGDGNYSKEMISYGTVSETLAKELILLLKGLEIDSTYSKQNTKGTEAKFKDRTSIRKHDNYVVRVMSVGNMKKFIDNVDSIKGNEKTRDYINCTEGRYLDNGSVIKDIEVVPYDRYVFDLETGEHWFTVNDYVVHNCLQIPLRKLLKDGFYIEGKFIREPKRISSAAELACIIIQSNQNDQHGGQAYGWFDRDLAPYVEKEYEYQLEEAKFDAEEDGIELTEERLQKKAWRKTVQETQRAMKGVIYNLNTMHARAGQMWAV